MVTRVLVKNIKYIQRRFASPSRKGVERKEERLLQSFLLYTQTNDI